MADTQSEFPTIIPLEEPEFGVQVDGRLVAVCPDEDSAKMVAAGLDALNQRPNYQCPVCNLPVHGVVRMVPMYVEACGTPVIADYEAWDCCPICGEEFFWEHALSDPKESLIIDPNEIDF